jgi:hypothetical protein
MPDLDSILLYRMTHIENIPHILKYGITHISSDSSNKKYVPIGDGSLINARKGFKISKGKILGEYIPFYFGPRMPMLYVMQQGYNMVKKVSPGDIVYCVTSIDSIRKADLEFVFTDGHAVDGFTDFFEAKDLKRIDKIIDWSAVRVKYWKKEDDLDLKRRKEAEFLVKGDIPVTAIKSFVVYDHDASDKLKAMSKFKDQTVVVRPGYYF